jgi:hypothetical protein
MRRNPARDRAFTRGRGAVDGDDHREPPASPGSLPSAALLDRGEAAVEAGMGPFDMTTQPVAKTFVRNNPLTNLRL